jgi:hypothetical protein
MQARFSKQDLSMHSVELEELTVVVAGSPSAIVVVVVCKHRAEISRGNLEPHSCRQACNAGSVYAQHWRNSLLLLFAPHPPLLLLLLLSAYRTPTFSCSIPSEDNIRTACSAWRGKSAQTRGGTHCCWSCSRSCSPIRCCSNRCSSRCPSCKAGEKIRPLSNPQESCRTLAFAHIFSGAQTQDEHR